MKLLPIHNKILEYLDKHGPVNTFRLSRDLGIGRAGLISIVKKLTKEGLTKFKSGVVTKGDKKTLVDQKITEIKEVKEEKPSSKPISSVPETPKKSKILKERYSDLEKVKVKIQRSKDNWLKKEEELKKEIEELQTQKERITQKLAKEKALLYQIRKERKETEKNLAVWEQSLSQREEAIQKREKFITREEERLKKSKERKIKLKAVPKKTQKLKKTQEKTEGYKKRREEPKIEKIEVSKTENKQPEIITKESWQATTEIGKEKVEDKFHDLIEQEIIFLKQKRINEAKDIHLKIKDMVTEIEDINQVKAIVKDWNRVKEFY